MSSQSVTNIANAIVNKINSLISSHNSNSNAHQDIRGSIPSASSTTPSADTTNGGIGSGITWARSDHTHPQSGLYADASHTHSDADITTLGFYGNLPQANYGNPSQGVVNFAINSAMGGKEDNANKVTSLSSSSTDTQYPSAKAVYDATFNLDTLDCINENFTLLSLPQIIITYNESSFDGSITYTLYSYREGAYVDWGDNTPIETYRYRSNLEHEYSDNIQEHTIIIYGNIYNSSLFDDSFSSLRGITSINIPSSVTSLGNYCFSDCTGLTRVTIPSSVTSIGNRCFYGCADLISVDIPSSVTGLGFYCFDGCTNLVDYQLYWETPPITWSSTLMPNNTDTYFTIPNGTTANYTTKGFPSDKLIERGV